MDINLIIYGIVMAVGLLGACVRFIPGQKSDNKVEEVAERVIEELTDVDVDLSPDTPEE